jgi:ribonucleotide monophosphatase NagD (HAD superfamily)
LICDKVVTGKPNPQVVDIIMKQHNIPKSELSKFVMFGDNPTADIALANNAGIDSVLVLTGVTKTEKEANQWCR